MADANLIADRSTSPEDRRRSLTGWLFFAGIILAAAMAAAINQEGHHG